MLEIFRSKVKRAETNKSTTQTKIGRQLKIDFGRAELCHSNTDGEFSRDRHGNVLEAILSRDNMKKALKRLKTNNGAPGVDGMTACKLQVYLETHWSSIKAAILSGTYRPTAVRQVMIKKAGGGERQLGIPTTLDRLIQQAISQRLNLIYDDGFSENSYGFRPGRNAHQAVERAKEYLNEGNNVVVELDLEKFFDKVNHDKLMYILSQRISDKPLLRLIRSYLTSGIMIGGIVSQRTEGTPQGSPLSPLLSNILLDKLDKELEQRGHKFVRYADDCSIYVGSMKAAERVKASITKYIETKLKLKVNETKTKISKATDSTLLGFSFYADKDGYQIRIAKKSFKRIREKVREATSRRKPHSLKYRLEELSPKIRGWVNYFKIAKAKAQMQRLDEWTRTRLRICVWKLWKRPRTKIRELINLGVAHSKAICYGLTRLKYCRVAHSPILYTTLTNEYLQKQGYVSFTSVYQNYRYV
jgi:RNA-directed DNA polymerase